MLKRSNILIIASILILSFFTSSLYAGDTLYFVGNINLAKKISYKYILRFTIGKDNKVTGYSLTDPRGNDEVKTKIIGNYDSIAKTINFEEQRILHTTIDVEKNDFCFVKATLKFKKDRFFETLSGKFVGTQPGKSTPCATGDIKLINTDKIKQVIAKVDGKPDNTIVEEKANSNTLITIADDKARYLPFTGKYVKITIWDNGKVDGDKVSIMLNDKYILENYTLDSKTKEIEASLSNNAIDTIKIIALNEGSLPPNTATIRIESKSEYYPIEIQANINEVRTIYLRKKKS